MHFFYWADAPSSKLNELLESAADQAITPQAIGSNTFQSRFHFSLFKQNALYKAVLAIPDSDIVCATDGFDVFYQRDKDYIERVFNGFSCDVVFSAERGYSHQYARYKPFFDEQRTDSPYRYLNAGSVIGTAAALRTLYRPTFGLRAKIWLIRHRPVSLLLDVLRKFAGRLGLIERPVQSPTVKFLPPYKYTDQAQMGKEVARGGHGLRYALDRDCTLFWCAAFEWDDIDAHYKVQGRHLVNKQTGKAPAIVHVPWGRKRRVFESLYQRAKELRSQPLVSVQDA